MSASDVLTKPQTTRSKPGGDQSHAKARKLPLNSSQVEVVTEDCPTLVSSSTHKTGRILVWLLVVLAFIACLLYVWRGASLNQSLPSAQHAMLRTATATVTQTSPETSMQSNSETVPPPQEPAAPPSASPTRNSQASTPQPSVEETDDSLLANMSTQELKASHSIQLEFERDLPKSHKFDVEPPHVLPQHAGKPNHPFRGASGLAATLLDLGRLPLKATPIHIAKYHNWAFHGWLQNLQSQRLDPVGGYTVVHFDTHSDMFGTYLHGGVLRSSGIMRIGRSNSFKLRPGINSPLVDNAPSKSNVPQNHQPKLSDEAYFAAQAIVGAEKVEGNANSTSPLQASKLNYLQITQLTRMLTIANYIPAGIMLGADLNYTSTSNDGKVIAQKSGQFIDHVIWVRPEIDSELNSPQSTGDWNITVGFMHLLERDVPPEDPRYGLPRNATLAQLIGSQLTDSDMLGGLVGLAHVMNGTEDPFAGSEWRPALRVNEYVSKIAYRYDGLFCCTSRGVIDAAFCNGFDEWHHAKYNTTHRGEDGRVSVSGRPLGTSRPIFGLDAFKTQEQLEAERAASQQTKSSLKLEAEYEKGNLTTLVKTLAKTSQDTSHIHASWSPWSSYLEGLADTSTTPAKPLYTYPSRTFRLTVVNPRQFIRMTDPSNEYVKTMDEQAENVYLTHEERYDVNTKKPSQVHNINNDKPTTGEALLPQLRFRPGSVLLDIDLDYFASTSEVRGMAVAEGVDEETISFAAESVRACCGHKTRFGARNGGCCAYLPHRIQFLRYILADLLEYLYPDTPELDSMLNKMKILASDWSKTMLAKAANANTKLPQHLRTPLECPALQDLAQNISARFSKELISDSDRMYFFSILRPSEGELFGLEPQQDDPAQTKLIELESEIMNYLASRLSQDYEDEEDHDEYHEDRRYRDSEHSYRNRRPLEINESTTQEPKLKQRLHVNKIEVPEQLDSNPLSVNYTYNARLVHNSSAKAQKRRVLFSRAERRRRTRERVQAIRRESELVRMLRQSQQEEQTETTQQSTVHAQHYKSPMTKQSVNTGSETASSTQPMSQHPSQEVSAPVETSVSTPMADSNTIEVSPIARKLTSYGTTVASSAHHLMLRKAKDKASQSDTDSGTIASSYRRSKRARRHRKHDSKQRGRREEALKRLSSIEEDLGSERAQFNAIIAEQYFPTEQQHEEVQNADAFCRILEFSEHLPSTHPLPGITPAYSRITGRPYRATYATQYLLRAVRGLREALKVLAPVTRVVTIARSNDVFLPPQLTQEVEWLVLSALHDSGLGLMQAVDPDSKQRKFIRLVQHDHSQIPSARPEGMCSIKFPFCLDFKERDEALFWESPYVHSGIGGHGAEVRRKLRSRTSPPTSENGMPVEGDYY